MTAMKTSKAAGDSVADVEAYLANVAEPARGTLEKLRATIRAAAPKDATEGMSYGMPAFRHKGALVAYAAFKKHCSFFPMSASLLDDFAEDVKGYRTAKGTLQFPQDKPLPAALVKRINNVIVRAKKDRAVLTDGWSGMNVRAGRKHRGLRAVGRNAEKISAR